MAMSQDWTKYQPGEPPRAEDAPPGVIISPDVLRVERIPPGQVRTRKWPILHYGQVPAVDRANWRFTVVGQVERTLSYSWEEFQKLPRVTVLADFHCVTRWSRLGNYWEGVPVSYFMEQAGVKSEARFVIAHGRDDGWTTNMPLADFASEDALVADKHDGEPLSADHGAPARLIVPRLYAWKSAKWLCSLEFSVIDKPGLWERAGYHSHGDPWVVSDQHKDGERYGW